MSFHLKHNQLGDCRVPSWICCNLEGNNGDLDESAAMDVYEGDTLSTGKCPCKYAFLFLSCTFTCMHTYKHNMHVCTHLHPRHISAP